MIQATYSVIIWWNVKFVWMRGPLRARLQRVRLHIDATIVNGQRKHVMFCMRYSKITCDLANDTLQFDNHINNFLLIAIKLWVFIKINSYNSIKTRIYSLKSNFTFIVNPLRIDIVYKQLSTVMNTAAFYSEWRFVVKHRMTLAVITPLKYFTALLKTVSASRQRFASQQQ